MQTTSNTGTIDVEVIDTGAEIEELAKNSKVELTPLEKLKRSMLLRMFPNPYTPKVKASDDTAHLPRRYQNRSKY